VMLRKRLLKASNACRVSVAANPADSLVSMITPVASTFL
jgi:hypothetical protein